MTGESKLPILSAFREKYACGVISPMIVMAIVENRKALIPANAESDSNVNNTLIPTLLHKIVVNKKFESLLSAKTFFAALLPFEDSTSSCKRLNENKAIFNPEKWLIARYKL